jgi:hypothetical protein
MRGTHEERIFEYDHILLILFNCGKSGKEITGTTRKKYSHY